MAIIKSEYPSGGPRMEREFQTVDDGVEAVLDVWEEDMSWAVGSGYICEDDENYVEFSRTDPLMRRKARIEAERMLLRHER